LQTIKNYTFRLFTEILSGTYHSVTTVTGHLTSLFLKNGNANIDFSKIFLDVIYIYTKYIQPGIYIPSIIV